MVTTSPSLTHLLPPPPPPTTQESRLRTPSTNPIPLIRNSLAKTYNRAHTVLVLLYVVVRFKALVADTSSTMLLDLGVLCFMQGTFCAICLPRNGSWVATTAPVDNVAKPPDKTARQKAGGIMSSSGTGSLRKRPTGSGKAGAALDASWPARIMSTILSTVLALVVPPIPLTVVALVMGAPLWPYNLLPLTILFSCHVAVLAVLPIFYTHGISSDAWGDVVAAWLPFDEAGVWGGFVGTFVGGWIGAVPMALDWDRDWQRWPVTVLTAAYWGWAAGRLLTAELGLGVGRRINLSESDPPASSSVAVEKKNG